MDVVLVMFKDGQRREFHVEEAETVIGRRQDCGLRIQTADVSRRHCMVSLEEDEVSVTDLESANGTYVNGNRVAETTLKPGDRLKIGPAVFVVQIDGAPAEIDPEDAQVDLVNLDSSDAPTDAAGKQPESGPDDTDDVMTLSEDELFETSDDDDDDDDGVIDLDDPLSEMEAILDDDEDDNPPAK